MEEEEDVEIRKKLNYTLEVSTFEGEPHRNPNSGTNKRGYYQDLNLSHSGSGSPRMNFFDPNKRKSPTNFSTGSSIGINTSENN